MCYVNRVAGELIEVASLVATYPVKIPVKPVGSPEA